ncbi:uncharacterized protein LOC132885169 [Neoarius graeffei]|uniref:uncharacterized protein LOC132885169 n=1 Tax=Neoarius graeffei TaxID=443677 RepID=UPI00298D210E|nr:uncharacterized protein LOC132885169 [Neoarius graeffei]
MSRTLGKRTAPSSRGRVVTGPTLSPGLPGQGIYIPVSISWGESVHSCQALIDSGAAGNFMDIHFAQSINIPTAPLEVPLSVSALDGQALGDGRVTQVTSPVFLQSQGHKEEISLHLIPSPEFPVILGLPWLTRHNPRIDWVTSQVVEWGPACHASCLLSSSPVSPAEPPDLTELSQVPTEYWDLKEVFSKSRAAVLPPHRAYDCAIDLLPGTTPPRGRLFSLSQPERKAMEEYLKDALVSGFIRPSTSPAGAGFFFVGKKDGGLRPCIDYRGLNKITVRNRYPLPLMSTAFDLLQGATVFTKLDLRNAYHLIRIRQGDEWKTAFNTPSGHYEYQVMPFGLTNAPAVFQALINDVLRDMINLYVFVYLDDILIFSKTVQEHRHHVRQVLQRLLQNNLFAKAQKCEFHVPEVSFLGFIVRTGQLQMDPAKTLAVRDWPTPKSVKEVQRFLGFANLSIRVVLSGQASEPYSINASVPQGSILGPLLFSIFIDNLVDVCENEMYTYPDDLTLYGHIRSPADKAKVEASLNQDLQQIAIWGDQWKTTFEPSKCKFVILSRKRTPSALDLHFNGHQLTMANELDILGVTIDKKLSWLKHLNKISIRAGQKLAALRRVASKLTTESRATVYKLQVHSVMEYASLSWMSASPTHLGLLDNIQKKVLKIIGVDQDTASTKHSISSLGHRRQVAATTVLFKMHTRHCPTDLRDMLPPPYPTRRTTCLCTAMPDHALDLPASNTRTLDRTFLHTAVRVWNSLPEHVVGPIDTGPQAFKCRVHRHLLTTPPTTR